MVARAAEWNVSIFRKQGMLPLMDVIDRYLRLSVDYDSYPNNAKYCVQNMLRDLQDSELGKKFLEAQTLEQICDVFELKDYCKAKQLEYSKKGLLMRKDFGPVDDDGPEAKRIKLDDGTIEENIAFIRSAYQKNEDLPKSILHMHTKKKLRTVPVYTTKQKDRFFRATVKLDDKSYSSTFWEKNKKCAEQGAAAVCLLHLGLMPKQLLMDNGSMSEL